jgi:hypothetical protein
MWFALSDGGELSKAEFMEELKRNRVCPLLVYQKDNQPIVPLFASQELAARFARRNTSKECSVGAMEAVEEDMEKLRKEGFSFEQLEWPNLRQVSLHILWIDREVEPITRGFRKDIS